LFVSGPRPALKNKLFFSGAREPAWDVQPSHAILRAQMIAVAVASVTWQKA
jgi:hypothetical protein